MTIYEMDVKQRRECNLSLQSDLIPIYFSGWFPWMRLSRIARGGRATSLNAPESRETNCLHFWKGEWESEVSQCSRRWNKIVSLTVKEAGAGECCALSYVKSTFSDGRICKLASEISFISKVEHCLTALLSSSVRLSPLGAGHTTRQFAAVGRMLKHSD